LARDKPGLVVVARYKDRFGIGRAYGSELGFEILVTRAVALFAHDGSAVLGKVVFEEICETHGIAFASHR
jgi:hypothetical protein